MVSPAMLKGMNTEVYGEGHPFGDPSWYQAYNTPYYNDTHKQFRKLMREYVDEHIMSNVHDWDEKGTIPKEMYLEAGKQGTLALCIGRPWPEKYFGPSPWGFEPDYFHELIMYDEMSRTGSVGFQWGIAGGTTIGLPPVYHHGSEELKNRVMPPCVKGEKVCCLAITEPTAGSDVANLKCTAKLEGDFYILNGEKKWITNGIFADYFTVACRTGKPGVGGISLLLVEKGMEGLECRKMKCSGAWSSGTTYITFDDVKVPKGNLLGKEGKGFQYMMQNFNHERFAFCAMSTRFARVCLEDSLKFASKRKTFGKTLIQHPVIRWKVAEMARMVEATHNWLEWITFQLKTMPKIEAGKREHREASSSRQIAHQELSAQEPRGGCVPIARGWQVRAFRWKRISGAFLAVSSALFFQTLVLRFARGHVEARRPHGALQGAVHQGHGVLRP
ncbi:unnamed protein product [Durusdinium trenchii]|uniref:Acyl-CoA dehydrogenase n=1 Tax=Durusdinium trenchii TaxID=1381693 RepID=A0ABP0NVP0_9DINO